MESRTVELGRSGPLEDESLREGAGVGPAGGGAAAREGVVAGAGDPRAAGLRVGGGGEREDEHQRGEREGQDAQSGHGHSP